MLQAACNGRAHRAARNGGGGRAARKSAPTVAWPMAEAAMTGWLAVVGLGPGDAALQTPQAAAALADATDLVGYDTYLARVPHRDGQARHASDNRVELDRARHAISLAAAGARVAVVSSGDPGVFAMASAVFEALEHGPDAWRTLDVQVMPGISAMFATAARLGAPLGADFCAISLSDNLKPWPLVLRRLTAAAGAGDRSNNAQRVQ